MVSKLYVATDSNPVYMQSYELCSDMIDVVIDVSCIYGLVREGVGGGVGCDSDPTVALYCIFATHASRAWGIPPPPQRQTNTRHIHTTHSVKYDAETGEAVEGSPYDADSASVIRLSNGMVLYLREVDE